MGLSETQFLTVSYTDTLCLVTYLYVYLIAGEYSCESAVSKPTVRLLCSGTACCERLFVNRPEL